MDRIPSGAVVAIVLVLIIGVAAGAFFKLIKPAQAELSSLQSKLEQEQATADKLESAKEDLIKVTGRWLGADTKLQKLMDRRSIKLSFGHPLPALFASLWPEMRQNLAGTIEEWVADQGVRITSGDSIAAPPPLPPAPPTDGFYQVAQINLGIQGTLSDIERLYRALPEFPRIATIEGLSLSGQGNIIDATLGMTVYLLVEVPPGLAAAGAAGAGMMGGMGMGGPMMGPGMMGPGGPMMAPGGPMGPGMMGPGGPPMPPAAEEAE
ncbi:MAG: hypothetical protein KAW89_06160 [Armatimonadetes bacterium]|nr:hypothetical protein [Armatimonadota bacterium]